MNKKNATSIVYLILTLVVAFCNILINQYQYILFSIPFIIAYILHGKVSNYIEMFGILIIGFYLMICQDESIGIMILFCGTATFIIKNNSKNSKYIIFIISIMIGIISFFTVKLTMSKIDHAILNSILYGFCSFATFLSVTNYCKKTDNSHVDQKYLDIIDELQKVAHESIDTLKHMQNEAEHDRSGKDC